MQMQPATYVAVQAPDGTIQHVQATPMFQMYPAHQQQYMRQMQLQQQPQQVLQQTDEKDWLEIMLASVQ